MPRAPRQLGSTPGEYVCGDAKATLVGLTEILLSRKVQKIGFRTKSSQDVLNAQAASPVFATDGLDPRRLAIELAKALPKESVITCGCGHYWSFVIQYMQLPANAEIYFTHQFGAIGQALPVAFGASIASPGRPHILIEGDGSLFMHLQELETVARYKLPLMVIVWNDSGFGAEVHKLRAHGFEPHLAQWQSPDFVSIAKAMGGGWHPCREGFGCGSGGRESFSTWAAYS